LSGIIVVLYDVSSAQRLIDTAKTVFGLGFGHLVVVKAYGAAASSGIGEANRIALKLGKSIAILPTLKDFFEIYNPDKIIVITRDYGEPLELDDIAAKICTATRPAIIFGGIDPAPGKEAAAAGEPVYIANTVTRLGPVAEAAIVLRAVQQRCGKQEPSSSQ